METLVYVQNLTLRKADGENCEQEPVSVYSSKTVRSPKTSTNVGSSEKYIQGKTPLANFQEIQSAKNIKRGALRPRKKLFRN